MSTSAFPFLDGRTTLDGPVARPSRSRSSRARGTSPAGGAAGVLERVRRHLHRAHLASKQREPGRREETDAYLDRAGMSSVDWIGVLTQQVHR
jgi:hypothetical protein